MDWQLDRASSVLLQNCDLPPPLKLFSPFHKQNNLITTTPKTTKLDVELEPESTSLLRALRLSQSRAREAEEKAAAAGARNDRMAALILEESLRLSAHRRWVGLLEVEIVLLQKRRRLRAEEGEDAVPALTWCLTLALCLGIGFALGRYMF